MNKAELIKAILKEADIHHNISTLGMKLPEAPDDAPDDIFWDTCNMLIEDFIDEWKHNKLNDSGNRNLCGCRQSKPSNLLLTNGINNIGGACKEHDLWHVYQHGRSGATLYWDKYWKSTNNGYYFKLDDDDLNELTLPELKKIYSDIIAFKKAVSAMMHALPGALKEAYTKWPDQKKENETAAIIAAIRPLTSKPSKNASQREKNIYQAATRLLDNLENA